jgi:hypothetical protein
MNFDSSKLYTPAGSVLIASFFPVLVISSWVNRLKGELLQNSLPSVGWHP